MAVSAFVLLIGTVTTLVITCFTPGGLHQGSGNGSAASPTRPPPPPPPPPPLPPPSLGLQDNVTVSPCPYLNGTLVCPTDSFVTVKSEADCGCQRCLNDVVTSACGVLILLLVSNVVYWLCVVVLYYMDQLKDDEKQQVLTCAEETTATQRSWLDNDHSNNNSNGNDDEDQANDSESGAGGAKDALLRSNTPIK